MRISVKDLKKEIGLRERFELQKDLPPLELKGEVIKFLKPVRVSLEVINAGDYLDASGTITTEVELTCGRCLEAYRYPLKVDFNEHYYPVEGESETADIKDEEGVPFTGESVDIEPEVKSNIQLSIPMRQICSEECRGLCSQCGTNLNKERCSCKIDDIDPRMAVLKDLFQKD
ncbi:uncharacterized protein JOC37_000776 [Desulfohalotomaculum tongense]|uniref:YceD family protein n=1 Tax=Desulforadius tongensis TaxID=1216062 RepID=UPI0019591775|nr:DUF177 domain-containing protein [Desulforadius tongensis]MBM7854403.1 uncharacterized protein [Desulforadius tongensis]